MNQIQIFKTWLLTFLLAAALTFAATIILLAPILLEGSDVVKFWRDVLGVNF